MTKRKRAKQKISLSKRSVRKLNDSGLDSAKGGLAQPTCTDDACPQPSAKCVPYQPPPSPLTTGAPPGVGCIQQPITYTCYKTPMNHNQALRAR